MNHREFFAPADINRKWLPAEYAYHNWNNSAVKGSLEIGPDSFLVYGNIGIWLADSTFTHYQPFNIGLPKGSDNQKTFDILHAPDKQLYAATQFGLYSFDAKASRWTKFKLDVSVKRFVGIEWVNDTIYAINRTHLFRGKSEGTATQFEKIELQAPLGYINDVTLFKTLWQLHSGEIFGLPGKLFVDLLGIITIFLSLTGIIYFYFPDWIIKRVRRGQQFMSLSRINKWSLKWHNKIGAWTFVFLIILYLTGMFLRPPMLIAIANSRVKPLKYSYLDQPNPWYDKLRDLVYDKDRGIFLLSTSEGMFYFEKPTEQPIPFNNQPPVSVMGITVFEPFGNGAYLIGSFSGLFVWHPTHPEIFDFVTGKPYAGPTSGRPTGTYKVTGLVTDKDKKRYMIDYDRGAVPLWHNHSLPEMPVEMVKTSTISLWNFSLEMHTGRLFAFLLGNLYILIVPLSSLAGAVVVLSGYLLWRKKYRIPVCNPRLKPRVMQANKDAGFSPMKSIFNKL